MEGPLERKSCSWSGSSAPFRLWQDLVLFPKTGGGFSSQPGLADPGGQLRWLPQVAGGWVGASPAPLLSLALQRGGRRNAEKGEEA